MYLFVIIFIFLFISPTQANAYIDPGSGSYMIQFLLAFLVGGIVMVKGYFSPIKAFLRKIFSKSKKSEPKDE